MKIGDANVTDGLKYAVHASTNAYTIRRYETLEPYDCWKHYAGRRRLVIILQQEKVLAQSPMNVMRAPESADSRTLLASAEDANL